MKKFIINQQGVTLIELLASITILSIVIITFLGFFTNAFRFNAINSDSIQAMNIAREQQALIKDPKSKIDVLLKEDSLEKVTDLNQTAKVFLNVKTFTDNNANQNYIMEIVNPNYHVTITINQIAEPFNFTYNELYLVHVEVKEGPKLLSETYTYYELGVGE